MFYTDGIILGKQADKHKIFNDGDKESRFHIGIDVMTLLAGTPNIFSNIKLTSKFVLNFGVGTSPFDYLFEMSGAIKDEIVVLTRNIENGYYYKANLRYYLSFTEKSKYDIFGQYYSIGFDHWTNPSTINESTHTKTRIVLNSGVSFDIKGRFNIEIEYGIYGGVYKETPNTIVDEFIYPLPFYHKQPNPAYLKSVKEKIIGLRLGAGLTFAL